MVARTMSIRDQAKLCFQKGKFSAAADAYTEAITQEPGNAALYQNRALCYQKLSKWTNVVEDAGGGLVPQACECVSLCLSVCLCACARARRTSPVPAKPPTAPVTWDASERVATDGLRALLRGAGAGKALQLAGDSVKAHYLLANAQLHLEQLEEAEASFQVARL